MKRLSRLALLLAAAAVIGVATSSDTGATTPGANGLIVYAKVVDGDHQLFTIRPDGTRDLRRDRPSQARRQPATNPDEAPHLQVLFTPTPPLLRMVEPIVESTFGPRVGHEMLSSGTTQVASPLANVHVDDGPRRLWEQSAVDAGWSSE